jgi:hypothetical protein
MDVGWDKKSARFYCLTQAAREQEDLSITSETFAEVGRNLELYPDLELMHSLKAAVQSICHQIDLRCLGQDE